MAVRKHYETVFLDNQPFRVKSYLRGNTDDLVARFGSAEHGQTNLDLLKALTQKSYKGGMFQRTFDDPERVSSISNGYFNEIDDNLYPTPEWPVTNKSIDMGLGVNSWCYMNGYFYITFTTLNSPTAGENRLYKIDASTGAETAVTLPTALKTTVAGPLTLCTFDGNIYIGGQPYMGVNQDHRYDGVTTFTAMGSGITQYFEFLGKLYGINAQGILFLCTTPTGTPSFTEIDRVGISPPSGVNYYQSSAFFNNAWYFGFQHGLYRFDGVAFTRVLDYRKTISSDNFKYMDTFNGRLYYNIKNQLFEFDGINIVKLQYFSAAYSINYIVGGTDRLWVGTVINTGVTFSDKFVSGAPVINYSVFAYNGIGFYEYRAFTNTLIFNSLKIALIPVAGKVFAFIPDVSANGSGDPVSNGYNMYTLTLTDEFTTTHEGGGFVVTSSEIDCDYPSVSKVLCGVMVDYGGLTSGEGSFKLEAQYLVDGVWSSWAEIWNTQNVGASGATNDYLLHEQVKIGSPNLVTAPTTFNKMRYRITCTITDTTPTTLPYLSTASLRYTIQPNARLKWLLTLQIDGVDTRGVATPKLSDGNREDRTASYLRKIIYDAFRNKKPILFYDVDYTELKTDSAPIKVKGVDFLTAGDIIAIQDAVGDADPWINRRANTVTGDDVNDESTISLVSFGYRAGIGGSANSALAVGAQVRKSYAVYVKRITNERYIIDDNTINDNRHQKGYSDAQSDLVVELVQV